MLRLLLAVAAIAVAALVSLVLPYDRDVRLAILLAGGPLLFGMLNTSSSWRSSRRGCGWSGRSSATSSAARSRSPRSCVVVALDLGFYAVMGAAAGGALATAGRDLCSSRAGSCRIRLRVEPRVWRRLLVTALPLGLALAINELYFRADTLIISLYEPYDQVGLYTLAYRILELTLVFGHVFLTTTFPVLSQAVDDDEPRAPARRSRRPPSVRGPRRAARGRRAGARARRSSSWPAASDFDGRRDAAADPARLRGARAG